MPVPVAHLSELFCPECGYDLRAIESDRCPECGWTIDRDAAATGSRIPWVHRRSIGRWRAYWRTAWLATWRIKQVAMESVRPVDEKDGRRFARIVMLSITLIVAAYVLFI